jgi:hypothetical protein
MRYLHALGDCQKLCPSPLVNILPGDESLSAYQVNGIVESSGVNRYPDSSGNIESAGQDIGQSLSS